MNRKNEQVGRRQVQYEKIRNGEGLGIGTEQFCTKYYFRNADVFNLFVRQQQDVLSIQQIQKTLSPPLKLLMFRERRKITN